MTAWQTLYFRTAPPRDVGNVLPTTDGPYRGGIGPITVLGMTGLLLDNAFTDDLIHHLAERYEENPSEFVHLPQPTVASAEARQTVSELRNEGYVEEEIRGVIRLTPRGYKEYKRKASGTKAWI
jgi:hypothetical protein